MDGTSECSIVGASLGTKMGKKEGLWLGPEDGTAECSNVGEWLGMELGTVE